MPLIATPAAIDANAYLTAARAVEILSGERLYATAFTSAILATQEAAIIWATALLDLYFTFEGAPWTTDQALRWPRYGALDADDRLIASETIPLIIERATAELALELVKKDRTAESVFAKLGLEQVKVDVLAATFNPKLIAGLVPDSIIAMVSVVGVPSAAFNASGGGRISNLYRS